MNPKPGAQEKPVVKQRPKVELEPTCWGGRLVSWLDVVACLEKGVAPKGQVSLCPSLAKAREAVALVTAHNLDVRFVCCIEQGDADLSRDDVKSVMLPFRVDGSLEFRRRPCLICLTVWC